MNFGYADKGSSNKNLEQLANIIIGEQFDIVALQEVLAEGKGIKRLLWYLGPSWQMKFCDAKSISADSRGEGYAFIWNSRKIQLVKAPNNPQTYDRYMGNLVRQPCYARFTPNNTVNGCFCEFRIICVHLYYGSSTGAKDIIKRQKEFEIVAKEIYPRIADKRYGNNMPAYTILLGDYNLNLPGINKRPWLQNVFEITDAGRIKQIVTVQEQKTSLKRNVDNEAQDNNDNDYGYANNFDHFTFDSNRFEGIGNNYQRIDAVKKYYKNDFETYKQEISDHIPILMDIELK